MSSLFKSMGWQSFDTSVCSFEVGKFVFCKGSCRDPCFDWAKIESKPVKFLFLFYWTHGPDGCDDGDM